MIKIFLFFILFIARVSANEEEAILKYLLSDDKVDIAEGIRLARKVDSAKVNEQLVVLLDCKLEPWGERCVFYLSPWQSSLLVLQKRFQELVSDGSTSILTEERASLFKKAWALHREKIVYNGDEVHSYSLPVEKVIKQPLLVKLSSPDVIEVERALREIQFRPSVTPEIIGALLDLLNDTRPSRRTSRDVISHNPQSLAYITLEKVVGFKPSQPSIHLDEKIKELRGFVFQRYPLIKRSE